VPAWTTKAGDDMEQLKRNYVRPGHSTAFAGVGNLKSKYARFGQSQIRHALTGVHSYTMHREVKRPRVYNSYYIYSRRAMLQADLIDTTVELAEENKDKRYLLTAIDCWSRFAYTRPVESKHFKHVWTALASILREMGEPPRRLLTDRGTEMDNVQMREKLEERGIKLMHPAWHAPHVERFNRSIQSLIHAYMTEHATSTYIDVLPRLMRTYNRRPHRAIGGLAPAEAENPANAERVQDALNKYYMKSLTRRKKPRYKVGDTVRLQRLRHVFARGYAAIFTDELFKIKEVHTRMPIPTYTVTDWNDTEEGAVNGRFYENELQLVDTSDGTFRMNVLREEKRQGETWLFVHWHGFGPEHDSWIPATNVDRDVNDNVGRE
jgi:transposase InsO family protein